VPDALNVCTSALPPGAELAQPEPVLVKRFPAVPAEERPVPPFATETGTERDTVGLPETPSPLVTEIPPVPAVIVLVAAVPAPVLVIKPFVARFPMAIKSASRLTPEAAVNRPCASTVMLGIVLAEPYVPGDTAVLASEMVPVEVIGPPVKPVPVATLLTEPEATLTLLTTFVPSQ
jgi:hypothetical protein